MGQPAARFGDQVIATDTHIVMIPSPGGPVPTPLPSPFTGIIEENVSTNVTIGGRPAATVGSIAINTPPHIPEGGPFEVQPTNEGEVVSGSATVRINKKPAARNGDTVLTCNDPVPLPIGKIEAFGNVFVGG